MQPDPATELKIVYIAGPYGDKDGYLAIDRNIAQAREAAAWLAARGIGFICPHLNSAHFEAIVPVQGVEFWYAMDLRLMEVADAILLLSGWEKSTGTRREIAHFTELAKGPQFFWDEDEPEERARMIAWALSS